MNGSARSIHVSDLSERVFTFAEPDRVVPVTLDEDRSVYFKTL